MAGDGRKIESRKPERVCHRCRRPKRYKDFTAESPYICSTCTGGKGATAEEVALIRQRDGLSVIMDSVKSMITNDNPDGPEFARAFIEALGGPSKMGQMAANDFAKVRGTLRPDGTPMTEEEYLRLGGPGKEAKTIRQWWEMVVKMQQENDTFKRDSNWLNEVHIEELELIVNQVVHKGLNADYIVDQMGQDAALRDGILKAIHSRPEWLHELAILPVITTAEVVADGSSELVESGDLGDVSVMGGDSAP